MIATSTLLPPIAVAHRAAGWMRVVARAWGADRARTYGVAEDKLGEFYAQRTLLKKEVLPEHVAAAVFALVGGDLSQTTGLHIPIDAGVAAAFLR